MQIQLDKETVGIGLAFLAAVWGVVKMAIRAEFSKEFVRETTCKDRHKTLDAHMRLQTKLLRSLELEKESHD